MATNIPPHNPTEVIDAVIAYMDRPGISIDKLMDYIPAPDFPTGGIVINASDMRDIYEKGEGKIRLRAVQKLKRRCRQNKHCYHGNSLHHFRK